MATLNATPATLGTVAPAALPGDTIILAAGTYTSFPQRAGITYQAADWAAGRAITGTTGHLGQGMSVRVTTALNLNQPGMVLRGIFHDTRGLGSINAGVISASNIVFEDCSAAARPTSGARQIGYTIGTGTIRVSGIKFLRCRHHPTGQFGATLDHAFYLKNCTGCLFQDVLVYDGGRFPFHLYTNADNNLFERCVIWGSAGCVTFSGASDASTGTATYGTSDGNTMRGCILGQARQGALVESWTSDPGRPVTGNIVDGCLFWPRQGGPISDGRPGVTVSNGITRDPGFRNPGAGDFTRTTTYDNYGPPQLATGTTPPPPPSEEPVITALRADLAVLQARLDDVQAALTTARGRIP